MNIAMTNTSATMIVPELLETGNYLRWSTCMENYLRSQDLWDVIKPSDKQQKPNYCKKPDYKHERKWNKKNYTALHAIQISCGINKFDLIYEINSAKEAWDVLRDNDCQNRRSSPDNIEESNDPEDNIEESNDREGIDESASLKLINFIHEGNVDAIKKFCENNPNVRNAKIILGQLSILQYAIISDQLKIVKALVKILRKEEMEVVDDGDYPDPPLVLAAKYGMTKIAKYLAEANQNLLTIKREEGDMPLVAACKVGQKDLTYFLYSETPFPIPCDENGKQTLSLALGCFSAKTFDILFEVLHNCPSITRQYWLELFVEFARTPEAFVTGSELTLWQQWIYDWLKVSKPTRSRHCYVCISNQQEGISAKKTGIAPGICRLGSILLNFFGIKHIYDLKLGHAYARESLRLICDHISTLSKTEKNKVISERISATMEAVKNGSVDFLRGISKSNADILVAEDPDTKRCIFMAAVELRQAKIVSCLYNLPITKTLMLSSDNWDNNVLHIVGGLAPSFQLARISGAALQMQREVQWFKEVESHVTQYEKDYKNLDGETPMEVFLREHNDLLKDAEKWMKETANCYIIVGALIVTVMFAAAFTLPGGNNQTGFPMFKKEILFMIYAAADAISLFSAATSVVTFLGLLTARYNIEDFHKSVPTKLILGLFTLFVSLAAMMIAFCSALSLMLERRWWVIILSMLLAGIPITLFVCLQFPLLFEIYVLTCKSPIFTDKTSLASKIKACFTRKKKIMQT